MLDSADRDLAAQRAALRRALRYFTVMAFIVGFGLLLLTLGVILRYGFDRPGLSQFWAQPHGFLFLGYVAATAHLGLKLRWSPGRMVLVMLAGCVPFLSFVAERRVTRQVRAHIDGRSLPETSPAGR